MIDKRMMYSQGQRVRNISLQEAKDMAPKGEFLAYINKKEAKMLKDAGGSGIMTNAGIPSFFDDDGDRFGGDQDARDGSSQERGDNEGSGDQGGHSRFEVGSGYYGETPTTTAPDNRGDNKPPPTFNIHTGPTYKAPPRVPDQIGFSTFGNVPGVDYSAVGPDSQFAINTNLRNTFPEYSFNSKIPSLNFLGNTIGKFGYDINTKFFNKNSIGGKINPETGQPFGYGIDGYKDYMRQRSLGNVGAYGGTELSQNALNGREGGDDGIMNVYNNPNDTDDGDADGDGDVDQTDDFIFRYFDKTGETLQAGAGGVEDLMTRIRQRLSNIFTT